MTFSKLAVERIDKGELEGPIFYIANPDGSDARLGLRDRPPFGRFASYDDAVRELHKISGWPVPVFYDTLRGANAARQKIWDPGDVVDIDWRCNEFMGEVGEVCNVIKKLYRERAGLPGSVDTVDHLAEELADTMICLDLLLMTAGSNHSIDRATTACGDVPAGDFSLTVLGSALGASSGRFVYAISLFDAGIGPFVGVACALARIARQEKIDLKLETARKFNDTSRKMGFDIILREH